MPHPDETATVRARSFGAIAAAYQAHRPGYPDPALDWALAPLGGPSRLRLLDLGAGTGKLTASLVDRGEVTAVEPDPEMLAVLSASLPTVTALAGTAEAIPVPDGSIDAVLVGQAFHWFDPEPATAEIARVLRPGGVLAALWNYEDQSIEWVRGYYRVVRAAEALGTDQPAPKRTGLEDHPAFERAATGMFDNPLAITVEGLLDNLATFSWISTLPDTERRSRMAQARAYLCARPETSEGTFELPLRTTVLRAVRRAGA
ncbi:MAG TPA: class I SAM-dependent methyltransferase [Pseudonocardia sp.]|jgi:SAM-dependent methyltransferase|nr:class I SAM-dependent methyltransferase [Pseudonocardia sp.]